MTRTALTNGATDFVKALLAFAGVVGLYLSAAALNLETVFWIVVAAALGYAALRWIVPVVKKLWMRTRTLLKLGRDHPRVLRAAAASEARAEDLESQLAAAKAAADDHFRIGKVAGRRFAIGEALSLGAPESLELIGMNATEGSLQLIVEYDLNDDQLVLWSTWRLRAKGTAAVLAFLQVVEVAEDAALLEVVEVRDESYVDRLRAHANTQLDPPKTIVIDRRKVESLLELREEV